MKRLFVCLDLFFKSRGVLYMCQKLLVHTADDLYGSASDAFTLILLDITSDCWSALINNISRAYPHSRVLDQQRKTLSSTICILMSVRYYIRDSVVLYFYISTKRLPRHSSDLILLKCFRYIATTSLY